jgi:hypothetical protein
MAVVPGDHLVLPMIMERVERSCTVRALVLKPGETGAYQITIKGQTTVQCEGGTSTICQYSVLAEKILGTGPRDLLSISRRQLGRTSTRSFHGFFHLWWQRPFCLRAAVAA